MTTLPSFSISQTDTKNNIGYTSKLTKTTKTNQPNIKKDSGDKLEFLSDFHRSFMRASENENEML